MNAYDRYLNRLQELQNELRTEGAAIVQGADLLAECIGHGGLVHVFGSGHSHMMAEEVFYRAGSLMAFNALLDINLTSFGTLRAGEVERTEGYAKIILNSFRVAANEVVIVVSNSGINPVPIDLAIESKKLGAKTIAVTSASAYANAASRHSSGKKLAEVCDLTIDSHVPEGDAILSFEGLSSKVAASSTALGSTLLNMLIAETVAVMLERGYRVPALVSMNVPGGDEHNRALIEEYAPRLRMMRG
ncbi:MAG: sugar isomerase domain-containing protein [Thermomicrobiales bacterium]